MKKLILISVVLISVFSVFAQNKNLDKIAKLYESGKYEKCINKSKDYISKDKDDAGANFYIFLSYLKEYEEYKDNFSVKSAAKNLHKALAKDNINFYTEKFSSEITMLHKLLKEYAYNYYEANKNQAKPFYEYLAEIFNDTLKHYDEIVSDQSRRADEEIIEQIEKGELNVTDENGLKQGKWSKVYPNGALAYEVHFENDKPIGEYKRYHENGKLSSVLSYKDNTENASAVFYDINGKKISEGNFNGKRKTGVWIYYKNDVKIKEEEYKNDTLDGFQITYFENGNIYDKKKFESGIQVGLWEKFHPNGNPHLKAFLVNGVMEGSILRYYSSGLTEVKGQYKNDLKEGIWTFYGEDGQKDIVEYKNGIDVNEDKVEKIESENYIKNIEKGKTIIDPEHYKDNPDEYPRK